MAFSVSASMRRPVDGSGRMVRATAWGVQGKPRNGFQKGRDWDLGFRVLISRGGLRGFIV